jgi:hypothetical protein
MIVITHVLKDAKAVISVSTIPYIVISNAHPVRMKDNIDLREQTISVGEKGCHVWQVTGHHGNKREIYEIREWDF